MEIDTDRYYDGGNYTPPWGEPFDDSEEDPAELAADRRIDEARDDELE